MRIEYPRQDFEKFLNIKFHDNRTSRSRVIPCGQTNRRIDVRTDGQTDRCTEIHDEANSRFLQFVQKRLKNNKLQFLGRLPQLPVMNLLHVSAQLTHYKRVSSS
jgi:hypothetical protein